METDACTTQPMHPRLIDLVARARRIAGPSGPILVEASDTGDDEVIAGYGARFSGTVASPFMLMRRARFLGLFKNRQSFSHHQLNAVDLDQTAFYSGRTVPRAQIASAGPATDLPALVPLVHRVSVRGHALCVIAPRFDEEFLRILVTTHHFDNPGCLAFCLSDEQQRLVARSVGRVRRTTGFFGQDSVPVSPFFDLVEVRATELLLFSAAAIGNLQPAARIVVGQARAQYPGSAVRAIRKALLEGQRPVSRPESVGWATR